MESVVVVERIEDLASLEASWALMADDLPFCHPGWMMPWWDVYGNNQSRKLFIVCVLNDQGSPIGIAPWFREQDSFGGQVIKFLGSGEVCSDYLTVLAVPGKEELVAHRLAGWLRNCSKEFEWEQLRFECIPSVGKTPLWHLVEHMDNHLEVCKTSTHSCWRIELPNGDIDEYMKRLSRNQRYQIRRMHRKHIETGKVTVEVAKKPHELEQQWPHLVDLHQKRRKFLGEPGCFADADFTKFLHDATLKLGESGKAAIFILKEDQHPVAAEHMLLGSSTVFAYQSGLDPSRLEITPGKLANYVTIQAAIADQKKYFDFCRGDEPYKSLWRAEEVACDDVRVIANKISAGVKHRIWSTSMNLKTWIKRTLAN